MEKEIEKCKCHHSHHCESGAIYGLGFIGTAIYFIGHTVKFWLGVLEFLKAIILTSVYGNRIIYSYTSNKKC